MSPAATIRRPSRARWLVPLIIGVIVVTLAIIGLFALVGLAAGVCR